MLIHLLRFPFRLGAIFALIIFLFLAQVAFVSETAFGQWTKLASNVVPAPTQHNGALAFRRGVAWVGTSEISVSTDTGRTWSSPPSIPTLFSGVTDISIFDSLHVAIATQSDGIYLTTDGGTTWSSTDPGTTRYSAIMYDRSANIIHVVDYNSPRLYTTTDSGVTWISAITSGSPSSGSLSMAIALDKTIYVQGYLNESGWLNASNNGGNSFRADGGQTDGDSNALAADSCDSKTLYLVNENTIQRSDNLARIDKTMDGGQTWQTVSSVPLDFYNGSIAITPEAMYVGTVPNGGNGVQRSIDHGATWKSIGGPKQEFDTHSIATVNKNIVLVLDNNGNIWRTMNSGGDSITFTQGSGPTELAISASPANILQRICGKANDTLINLGIVGCGAGNGTIDSVWLTGSSAFHLNDSRSTPRALGLVDSIPFTYLNSGSKDNAVVHVRYNIGFGIRDTAVSLAGSLGSPMMTQPAVEHREETSAYTNHEANLTMAIDISSLVPYDSLWPFITDIQGTYSWDGTILHNAGYAPPAGWHATSINPANNSVSFAIHKDSANWANPLLLGTANFTPVASGLSTSWVTLNDLSMTIGFNTSQVNVSLCLSENEDNHWSVKTLGPSSWVSETSNSELQLSLYPNPANGTVWLSSNQDLGQATIEIYDILGTKSEVFDGSIVKGSPLELVLPQAKGIYTIIIRSIDDTKMLRVVKEK